MVTMSDDIRFAGIETGSSRLDEPFGYHDRNHSSYHSQSSQDSRPRTAPGLSPSQLRTRDAPLLNVSVPDSLDAFREYYRALADKNKAPGQQIERSIESHSDDEGRAVVGGRRLFLDVSPKDRGSRDALLQGPLSARGPGPAATWRKVNGPMKAQQEAHLKLAEVRIAVRLERRQRRLRRQVDEEKGEEGENASAESRHVNGGCPEVGASGGVVKEEEQEEEKVAKEDECALAAASEVLSMPPFERRRNHRRCCSEDMSSRFGLGVIGEGVEEDNGVSSSAAADGNFSSARCPQAPLSCSLASGSTPYSPYSESSSSSCNLSPSASSAARYEAADSAALHRSISSNVDCTVATGGSLCSSRSVSPCSLSLNVPPAAAPSVSSGPSLPPSRTASDASYCSSINSMISTASCFTSTSTSSSSSTDGSARGYGEGQGKPSSTGGVLISRTQDSSVHPFEHSVSGLGKFRDRAAVSKIQVQRLHVQGGWELPSPEVVEEGEQYEEKAMGGKGDGAGGGAADQSAVGSTIPSHSRSPFLTPLLAPNSSSPATSSSSLTVTTPSSSRPPPSPSSGSNNSGPRRLLPTFSSSLSPLSSPVSSSQQNPSSSPFPTNLPRSPSLPTAEDPTVVSISPSRKSAGGGGGGGGGGSGCSVGGSATGNYPLSPLGSGRGGGEGAVYSGAREHPAGSSTPAAPSSTRTTSPTFPSSQSSPSPSPSPHSRLMGRSTSFDCSQMHLPSSVDPFASSSTSLALPAQQQQHLPPGGISLMSLSPSPSRLSSRRSSSHDGGRPRKTPSDSHSGGKSCSTPLSGSNSPLTNNSPFGSLSNLPPLRGQHRRGGSDSSSGSHMLAFGKEEQNAGKELFNLLVREARGVDTSGQGSCSHRRTLSAELPQMQQRRSLSPSAASMAGPGQAGLSGGAAGPSSTTPSVDGAAAASPSAGGSSSSSGSVAPIHAARPLGRTLGISSSSRCIRVSSLHLATASAGTAAAATSGTCPSPVFPLTSPVPPPSPVPPSSPASGGFHGAHASSGALQVCRSFDRGSRSTMGAEQGSFRERDRLRQMRRERRQVQPQPGEEPQQERVGRRRYASFDGTALQCTSLGDGRDVWAAAAGGGGGEGRTRDRRSSAGGVEGLRSFLLDGSSSPRGAGHHHQLPPQRERRERRPSSDHGLFLKLHCGNGGGGWGGSGGSDGDSSASEGPGCGNSYSSDSMAAHFLQHRHQQRATGSGHVHGRAKVGSTAHSSSGSHGVIMDGIGAMSELTKEAGAPGERVPRAGETGPHHLGPAGAEPGLWEVQHSLRPDQYVLRKPYEDLRASYQMLDRRLGRGQFGSIRLCREVATGKEFACKSIPKSEVKTYLEANDVRVEVQAMATLKEHPSIIQLQDTFEDKKAVHIVMELCNGGDLFDCIKTKGALCEPDAAMLCQSLIEALLHCHCHGIIHRDVKPENILLVEAGNLTRIKLIDFGVATTFEDGVPCTDVSGTPEFMAPEVLRRSYGPEADIWSAGVVLFMLLTSRLPFWGATRRAVCDAILEKGVSFASRKWDCVSEDAKHLVSRMLTKDPRQRITALEVLGHPWMARHL